MELIDSFEHVAVIADAIVTLRASSISMTTGEVKGFASNPLCNEQNRGIASVDTTFPLFDLELLSHKKSFPGKLPI
ncbi:MAG: hypothetical protein C4324_01455 [Blastocatellia bacterium]